MPELLRAPTREYRTATMDSHRWDGFSPRPGDIVIGTFAKCGTTWTQRIVDLLIFQTPDARPVTATAPWLDATFFAPVEANLATLEAQTHRRFVKTHMPFDAVPLWDDVSYIHVARDGLDACMSMHNHLLAMRPELLSQIAANASKIPGGRRPGPTPEDPRAFYRHWIQGAEAEVTESPGIDLPFFEFETTYWAERRRANMLLVHYNDLKADLAGEMRRIAAFLSIEVPQAKLAGLAEAAGFEAMKREGADLMPGAERGFTDGAERFFFKGTNGRWRDCLTAEDLARYDALARRKWTRACEAWVRHGRRIAGEPREAPD